MKRTGEVYDDEKLRGANIFEEVLRCCWEDGWYGSVFGEWREGKRETILGSRNWGNYLVGKTQEVELCRINKAIKADERDEGDS